MDSFNLVLYANRICMGVEMIRSTANGQIKNIIRLQTKAKVRSDQKAFVIEGIKMFREAPKDKLIKTYVSESFIRDNDSILLPDTGLSCPAIDYEVLSDHVFKSISDTVTPQGILAIVKKQEYSIEHLIENNERCFIILEGIQDPGNLGTIIRTGEGAGISAVIMDKNTVDIYNPKVIRTTMGSIYRVPFLYTDRLTEIMDLLRDNGITMYAAHLDGNISYYQADYTGPSAFLIGNEANGLSEELSSKADYLIKIDMCGQVESLNAGVAASLLMYEMKRQHDIF